MRPISVILVSATAALLCVPVAARGPDGASGGPTAQDRLDRDQQRAATRADEVAARYAAERARIEERAARDPGKTAQDLAKLDADLARERTKLAEDQAKSDQDYASRAAKEAEDAARRLSDGASDRAGDQGRGHESGSSEQIRDLGEAEGAEHDGRGYPVRRGEVVALDLAPETLARAKEQGFRVIEQRAIPELNSAVTRLAAPEGLSAAQALELVRAIDPAATVDLVHYYGLNLTAGSKGKRIGYPGPGRAAPGIAAAAARVPTTAIGMIDTAVAPHAALNPVKLVAWAAGQLPTAPVGHGTAVASLLAREGAPTIYAANVFRGTAERPFTSADVIAEAFEWLIANRITTINMSLAGPRNAILDRLIRSAQAHGFLVVAAAGNGGPTAPPAYPAAVPGVIAVTAIDRDHRIYRYANHGRYIAVAALGVDVVAARAAGGYARFDGTSFATPHVAGWISRCRAAASAASDCAERLRHAARDLGPVGVDETYGYGLID